MLVADEALGARRLLIRQEGGAPSTSDIRDRLATAGVAVPQEDWIRLPERDEWLQRHDEGRAKADVQSMVARLVSSSHKGFLQDVDTLGEVVDESVAVPRTREVGCVRVDPLYAQLSSPFFTPTATMSRSSQPADVTVHLSMYEEWGVRYRDVVVWGSRGVRGLGIDRRA